MSTITDGERLIRVETRIDALATKEDVAHLKGGQQMLTLAIGFGFVALGALMAFLKYLG